ncbi:hypothetical protein A2673_02355 [Candidatus Kaiserbacteria bacterium RIFCSPHIGHO2_01_FULL_50_13]|uniref:Prepilin peptidase n=1 Tax=Candidatus Kaiserbacteria bacterium RIFCSPLOWO2_01_FULL_50_24 TaxID=1798507 RepID=A0A1F6ERF0_9BACT|nr:MAG: hypothetical protein A2673_02355 [Candidatus Kaiserbacteria bacterium RIFCSPHIGHO2_01_FULL_50_13]OGG76032.1 MAG: hypothetical protein A3A34_00060 [Candidatus Kaiserbacteria bacterium RIFCSPLOWO2_01_FULL_50_24]OGG82038.1 MAG: hypothetical protein A3H74_03475 [Candidatus Kaiserbacteria bacterium RIFCSPLOWO2_02_FULL_51_13]
MLEGVFYLGLGLIVGSFLNVLAVRFHDGRSLGGRSVCVSCGQTIYWYDLIPVLSWILLLGKCRSCGQDISLLYPLTEVACGAAFLLIGLAHMPFFSTVLALPIAALLIVIARYDLSHMLIPNVWVYLFAALSLSAALYPMESRDFVFNVLAGPVAAVPFLALWFVSRGAWMGLGDAKLALGMGWLLGLEGGVTAILSAFVLGAVVGLGLMFFSSSHLLHRTLGVHGDKKVTMKSEIPFGPFLIISCFIVWFAHMYGIQTLELFLWWSFW